MDPVRHPVHYAAGRFGCQCIDIARLMSFCAGNAFKYLWRWEDKGGRVDLEKSRVYLEWCAEEALSSGRDVDAAPAVVWLGADEAAEGMKLLHEHVAPNVIGVQAAMLSMAVGRLGEALSILGAEIDGDGLESRGVAPMRELS